MNEAAALQTPAVQNPRWQRVDALVDLVEIFEPDVQICALPRQLGPELMAYLSGLDSSGELQIIETIERDEALKLERLPEGHGKAALIQDLSLLRDIVCDLVDCEAVGLRLARVNRAMCPGWHIDHTGIRLVSTYQGPGTQWLEDQDVDRSLLGEIKNEDRSHISASEGEMVLLKGDLWQENEGFGSVHRSPEIIDTASLRTVVTIDPLWLG